MAKRRQRPTKRKFSTPDEFEAWLESLDTQRLSRRTAFQAGNLAALFDALTESMNVAPPGELDASIPVPRWVLEGARTALEEHLRTARTGRFRGPKNRWIERFRQDHIDWDRYLQIWFRAIGSGHASVDRKEARPLRWQFQQHQQAKGSTDLVHTGVPYPWSANRYEDDWTVFEAVSKTYPRGCIYAGSAIEMRKSYERVNEALRNGEAWRYYPSRWVRIVGQMRSADEHRAK